VTDSLYDRLEDAAYVAVGAALLTFQRAQVQRHELERWLESVRADLDAALDPQAASPKG
jgi:hypothetical protein